MAETKETDDLFSEGERAYFDSRGEKDIPVSAATPTEAKPEVISTPRSAPPVPETKPADKPEVQATVPQAALHEERKRRQDAEERIGNRLAADGRAGLARGVEGGRHVFQVSAHAEVRTVAADIRCVQHDLAGKFALQAHRVLLDTANAPVALVKRLAIARRGEQSRRRPLRHQQAVGVRVA